MINAKESLRFLPTIGIFIFIILYIYAATLYPGGSQADINSLGFDWSNNYWCNLMSENGINGLKNNARPVAIGAISMLCISMTFFFFQFADYFEKNRNWNLTIKISGALGMLSAVFIFTKFHDVMTTILSICGVVVIIGMIRALHKNKFTFFKVFGIFCMVIVGMNNLFYYNENLIQYSPLVQKAAFILILSWTVALNLKMKKKTIL
ncbi:hypothetical protein [Tamlana flava]|uniref:hypothetical protein n=1 Tax=Tamlana flava TaxID=3158572 RepID=UPI00351AD80D